MRYNDKLMRHTIAAAALENAGINDIDDEGTTERKTVWIRDALAQAYKHGHDDGCAVTEADSLVMQETREAIDAEIDAGIARALADQMRGGAH